MSKTMRSKNITEGIERAAHRSLLHCVGLDKEDFDKPLVGVVNSWNDIVPGHYHLNEVAEYVRQGIHEAGGLPREFNTIAICDGLCQGHKGMNYPLPSREIIADSVEVMVQAHQFDAMVMVAGCDKIVPAYIMAALRIDIPTIFVTAGPMEAGGIGEFSNITLTDMREFIGKTQSGEMTLEELEEIEKHALPGPGACAMMGTANTMGCLTEALGLSLPGNATTSAVQTRKYRQAKRAGRQSIKLIENGITPRNIVNKDGIINAIITTMALGGSTNSVLHLMAIANEANVELTLDTFDKISKHTPHICDIKPSGKYPMSYLDHEGGVYAVLKVLNEKLYPNQLTVTGDTIIKNIERFASTPSGKIIKPVDNPVHDKGCIAVLKGNLAPNGAVVKQSAVKRSMLRFIGKAKVYDSMEEANRHIMEDKINEGTVIVVRYEGPKGGPGMREMHMITSLIVGKGLDEKVALITDGRFSGSTRGPAIGHISPEAAAGGNIGAVKDGDEIEIDILNGKIELLVDDLLISKRLKEVQPPVRVKSGALARYANLVTSADQGAILISKT